MADIPDGLHYSEEHEWLRIEGEHGVVGITAYAAERMGDVVFVELPEAGATVAAGETFGAVESPKAMADLYAPASGEVVESNTALEDHPEFVSEDPYGAGWMIKIRMSDPSEAAKLMDGAAYASHIAED